MRAIKPVNEFLKSKSDLFKKYLERTLGEVEQVNTYSFTDYSATLNTIFKTYSSEKSEGLDLPYARCNVTFQYNHKHKSLSVDYYMVADIISVDTKLPKKLNDKNVANGRTLYKEMHKSVFTLVPRIKTDVPDNISEQFEYATLLNKEGVLLSRLIKNVLDSIHNSFFNNKPHLGFNKIKRTFYHNDEKIGNDEALKKYVTENNILFIKDFSKLLPLTFAEIRDTKLEKLLSNLQD